MQNGKEDQIPEIEVTPEMVEAGVRAAAQWDPRFEEPAGLVEQVYEAMELARRQKHAHPKA